MSSTSAAPAANNTKFLKEDVITFLNSLVENNKNPQFVGNYTEGQIRNKENRLKQKFRNARRLGIMKTSDLEAYRISNKLWGTPEPNPEGAIRWTDYPHVMRHVAHGNEALIKQGLQRLGAGAIMLFERQWAELDIEWSALQAKKAQLSSSSS